MGTATLGGISFRLDPREISWEYSMRVVEKKTLGGRVVQILGTSLGDMTIRGEFGKDGWPGAVSFFNQVKRWARQAETSYKTKSIRFVYPPRGWDFQVYIKDYPDPVIFSNEEINHKYSLVLFIVDDSARKITKGIRDLYIKRLMEGVGWRQGKYNGPQQAKIDGLLQGRTATEFLVADLTSFIVSGEHLPTGPILTPFGGGN